MTCHSNGVVFLGKQQRSNQINYERSSPRIQGITKNSNMSNHAAVLFFKTIIYLIKFLRMANVALAATASSG